MLLQECSTHEWLFWPFERSMGLSDADCMHSSVHHIDILGQPKILLGFLFSQCQQVQYFLVFPF